VRRSGKRREEDCVQPELHSDFTSERLRDDHGTRPDDPTAEDLIVVDDDAALLPAAVPPGESEDDLAA
jgi:hypothetical protein